MQEKSILVIDDSSTIRRLVDRELGNSGFRVLLAENAELGIAMARSEKPDLILLDHQLPGTTGFNVCGQLLQDPELRSIPVVVSSTLRKKAYVEYTDCSNVVDMLPKPYTGDLLRTTVSNALDTAAMIVQSQSAGTAVPEVIDVCGDSDLLGTFSAFQVRELIDFLTNGEKHGVLELECDRCRISIYLDKGRIQAVTASGVHPSEVADRLPPALADLAPMIKFTILGRQTAQLDGVVELLDNRVLDARLLRQLLRHQAAVLLQRCFQATPKSFRFDADQTASQLFTRLPLDISLLALAVDGALLRGDAPAVDESREYIRTAVRGQSLDRAGLSASHLRFLTLLNSPMTANELAQQTGCSLEEVMGVVRGMEQVGLVTGRVRSSQSSMIALCADAARAQQLTAFLRAHAGQVQGKVVRDALAVKLLLRRSKPNFLMFDFEDAQPTSACRALHDEFAAQLKGSQWLALVNGSTPPDDAGPVDGLVSWNNLEVDLRQRLGLARDGVDETESKKELADCV